MSSSNRNGNSSTHSRMSWLEMPAQRPTRDRDVGKHVAHCSLCGHPFDRGESKVFPFCSVRCQQIDLGHWLEEKHGLPLEGQEDQEFTGQDD